MRSTAYTLLALLALFAGCDQSPADPPGPCADLPDAVGVMIDGGTWCAHHDVARFTCPEALPHRGAYSGVAFCGARAVDEETAVEIARAALRTGEVLAPRGLFGFDVPAEWRAEPGAPRDMPLEINASTVTASNVSWATQDGDPFLCVRDGFEGFEVEPDGAGRLHITAWDRLRCDPAAIGQGAELHETLPLTLPGLSPGRYLLTGPSLGYATRPAPLVVDLRAICPDPLPWSGCFRGHFFAECGISGMPAPGIWCDPEAFHRCLWADCPPAGFLARDCEGDPYCPTPHVHWGPEPWDRARAMALTVEVDPELAAAPPSIRCEATHIERPQDLETACGPADAEFTAIRSPAPAGEDWGWPSLIGITAYHATGGLSTDRLLYVEVDVFADDGPRGRACLIETSDGGADGAPVCAAAGAITLDRVPASPEDVAGLNLRLRAEFADFELFEGRPDTAVRGLVIDARL